MKQTEFFSSRWALILAALGMAVGTGNIWRFPRVAAQNGGGSFLIPWVIFLFLWSIPLLIIEFSMGKETRKGAIGAFSKFLGEKFTWMGAFVGFCTMAIMFYYSVVMGWCVKYFVSSAMGDASLVDAQAFWDSYTAGNQPIFFHLISVCIGSFIIYKGVVKGIERTNRILIPALFLMLVLAAVRALTLDGAMAGMDYLFSPDLSRLMEPKTWLAALTQSAWSTGAGWGLILTYAVYMNKKEDIVLNTFVAGLGNNSASLLAGIALFPAVFAIAPTLGLNPETVLGDSGPASTGMTFIWMPRLFEAMPMGYLFRAIFFLALAAAALSSLIAMLELATRIFMDAGFQRKKAILIVGSFSFLLGVPSAMDLNTLNNQDWVWGLGLIVSGLFFVIAAIKHGADRFRTTLINCEGNDIRLGKWFNSVIKFLMPVQFVCLLGWWFYKTVVGDPDGWWKLDKTFGLSTVLLQWSLAIIVFLLLNKWLYKKSMQES